MSPHFARLGSGERCEDGGASLSGARLSAGTPCDKGVEALVIPPAVLVPTEGAPTALEIKQALLTFDTLALFHPEDRELIPRGTLSAVQMGMPLFGMDTGPVRPLGKAPGYDQDFEQMLEDCRIAMKQDKLYLLPYEQPKLGVFTIGGIHVPEGSPNPHWVYNVYRALSEDPAWVTNVQVGVDQSLLREHADLVAPPSADEGQFTQYVNGQEVRSSAPLAAISYEGLDEETVLALARLAHARLGAVVRTIAVSELRELTPLADRPGASHALSDLGQQLSRAAADSVQDPDVIRYIGRVHRVLINEEIDVDALASMSVKDVLKMRSRAWGRANEGREQFLRAVRVLALECTDDEAFDERVRAEVDAYRAATEEREADLRRLLRMSAAVGGGTATNNAIVTALTAATSVSTAVAIVATGLLAGVGGVAVSEVPDYRTASGKYRSSTAYAIGKPYKRLLSGDAS